MPGLVKAKAPWCVALFEVVSGLRKLVMLYEVLQRFKCEQVLSELVIAYVKQSCRLLCTCIHSLIVSSRMISNVQA